MIITDAIKVMRAGEVLKNPARWKKGQILSNAVVGLIAGLAGLIKWKFPDAEIPQVAQDYAVEIITGLLALINVYFAAATTDKISITGKEVKNG